MWVCVEEGESREARRSGEGGGEGGKLEESRMGRRDVKRGYEEGREMQYMHSWLVMELFLMICDFIHNQQFTLSK